MMDGGVSGMALGSIRCSCWYCAISYSVCTFIDLKIKIEIREISAGNKGRGEIKAGRNNDRQTDIHTNKDNVTDRQTAIHTNKANFTDRQTAIHTNKANFTQRHTHAQTNQDTFTNRHQLSVKYLKTDGQTDN
jgi:hypothetical protein